MSGLLYILLLLFCCTNIDGGSNCGKVHLTVSSQYHSHLELNWVTDCEEDDPLLPEHIVLSSKNVAERDEDPGVLAVVKFSDHPSGYYRTKVNFGHPWLPGGWEYDPDATSAPPGLHCYPYWIAAIAGNITIDTNCLGIRPTWMADNSEKIGNLRIGSMFIPGTHNAGSYAGVPPLVENYVLNQDRNVWTQLVSGIRYLDFRIGYYDNEGFFINHDLVRVTKVIPILRQINKFLELAPNEIVVIDFHRFPYPTNFTSQMHKDFVDILYKELRMLILPPWNSPTGKGPTLNEIWTMHRHLIICYADRATIKDNPWLWHPLQQFWGDTKRISELKRFMEHTIKEERIVGETPMWALMAELTPTPIDVIFRRNSLRKLAQDVNGEVTKWFRDEWPNETNIVATDFFLGNDLINVAIQANIMQGILNV